MFTMFTMRRGIARMKMGSCVLLIYPLLILHRDMTLPVSNNLQCHTMTATSCYFIDLLCPTIQMRLYAPVWTDPRRLNKRLSKTHIIPVQPLYFGRQLLSNVSNIMWKTSLRASAIVLMY